jgi:hypothetical protein
MECVNYNLNDKQLVIEYVFQDIKNAKKAGNILKHNKTTNKRAILKIIEILSMTPNNFKEFVSQQLTIYHNGQQITTQNLMICAIYANLHKLDINKIIDLQLNKVEVKKSNVHGNGVFATQQIAKCEVVTLYPFHVIFKNGYDKYKFAKNINPVPYNQFNGYKYTTDDKHLTIAGLPNIHDNPTYLGHILNDYCNSSCETFYREQTLLGSNCIFQDIVDLNNKCIYVAVITIADIGVGEELFVSYGNEYWKTM